MFFSVSRNARLASLFCPAYCQCYPVYYISRFADSLLHGLLKSYYGSTTWCVLAVAVVSSCATVGHSIGQSKAYFKALRRHDS